MLAFFLLQSFSILALSEASILHPPETTVLPSSHNKESESSEAISIATPIHLGLPGESPVRSSIPRIKRQVSASCRRTGQSLCSRNFPIDFCCDKTTTCKILAGATTALCCPDGSCSVIMPRSCNINWLDVEQFPDAPIVSSALDYKLPSCGKDSSGEQTCCPFGYSCGQNGTVCVLDKDQRSLKAKKSDDFLARTQTDSSSSTLPTATATSTSPTKATSTTAADSAPEQTTGAQTEGVGGKQTNSSTVGIAVGSALGAAAMIGVMLCLAWKKYRISESVSRLGHRHSQEKHQRHRRFLPSWVCRNLQRGEHIDQMPTPPPPAYAPYHLDLDKCRRVPRRKTVPPSRNKTPAQVMQECSPVELPASPVSFSFWNTTRASQRSTFFAKTRVSLSRPLPRQQPPPRGPHNPEYPDFF